MTENGSRVFVPPPPAAAASSSTSTTTALATSSAAQPTESDEPHNEAADNPSVDGANNDDGHDDDAGQAWDDAAGVNQPAPDVGENPAFMLYMPYKMPSYFALRLFGLLNVLMLSVILLSLGCLVAPVSIGRYMLQRSRMSSVAPKHDAVAIMLGAAVLGLLVRILFM